MQDILESNSPDSLVCICTDYCIHNLETFCCKNASGRYVLRPGLSLPSEICEGMLTSRLASVDGGPIDDAFLKLFSNPLNTRVRRVNLRNSSAVTDFGLLAILKHNLLELDISNCPKITEDALDHINDNGEDLLSLIIGNSVHILPETLHLDFEDDDNGTPDSCRMGSRSVKRAYILNTPNLRRLVITNWGGPLESGYLSSLFQPLPFLTHLDLSGSCCLGTLSYISHLKYLVSLVLYSVPNLSDAIPYICLLKNLRHLDVSQHGDKLGVFSSPNQVLAQIVQSLPNLASLDISGTNLAGTGVAESDGSNEDLKDDKDTSSSPNHHHPTTDIPGLRLRVARPLDFLGLLNTTHDACLRHHIPAKKVTGDANEKQILTAAQAYLERSEVLQKVLNDLFRLFRYERCHNSKLALKLILQAMQTHLSEKHIQVSGSASLFYIVKSELRATLNIKVKRSIIKALLDAMCEHKTDSTMMRNGCLTLCNFRIPQDVLFDYGRLVDIVLHTVSVESQEEFVQRIGIYLLNSLACQVEGSQKQLVGELGAIQTMLKLIDRRLRMQSCDEVMEIAWSTMWNVTDETPANCKRFLDGRGMEYFLKCLQAFPNKSELLRNMMGLLGNVAEVHYLRSALMIPEYIRVFRDLLDSNSDGIEVSYNAAGVLSHIASNGPAFWTVISPSRQEVLTRMAGIIQRWDIQAKRNINYRSFEPIFRLLRVDHTPEAQHWAIWALANLTRVYPEKYCPLVKEEGGLEMLHDIGRRDFSHYPTIRDLAQLVIMHCERYDKYGTLEDNSESIQCEEEERV